MTYYAGIDVSLEYSSICVVDGAGKIIREQRIASEPEALIAWFRGLGFGLERIGLEAGPMSQWLYAAMRAAGLAVELLETHSGRPAALYRFHCPLRRFVGHLYRRFRDPAGALKETLQIVTQEFALDRGHVLRSAAEQQAFEAIEILLHALTREIHPRQFVAVEVAARFDDFLKLLPRPVQPHPGVTLADAEGLSDFLITQPAERAEHEDVEIGV